jgi:hypothetical protein
MYGHRPVPRHCQCSCLETCESAFQHPPPPAPRMPARPSAPRKSPCCDCQKTQDCSGQVALAEQKIYPKYFAQVEELKKRIIDNNQAMEEKIRQFESHKQEVYRLLTRQLEDYEDAMLRGMQYPVDPPAPQPGDGACHCKCRHK